MTRPRIDLTRLRESCAKAWAWPTPLVVTPAELEALLAVVDAARMARERVTPVGGYLWDILFRALEPFEPVPRYDETSTPPTWEPGKPPTFPRTRAEQDAKVDRLRAERDSWHANADRLRQERDEARATTFDLAVQLKKAERERDEIQVRQDDLLARLRTWANGWIA